MDFSILIGISVGISIAAFVCMIICVIVAVDALTTVKAMKESTHQIQYVPLEEELKKGEDKDDDKDDLSLDASDFDSRRGYEDYLEEIRQKKLDAINRKMDKVTGVEEEELDSII